MSTAGWPPRPWPGGGGRGGADRRGHLTAADAAPQLSLPAAELAALWLGGGSARRLADAGRITEHAPAAASRLDELLATDRRPWTPFEFSGRMP